MATPGAAPARLGRYELLARLAAGGMGEIFLARLEGAAGFEKLFVIKRILPHLADDERFRAMLISEARIASMMTHANICQVYELGETDGQLYIAMEYLEGVTLLPLLRKRLKESSALDLGFVAGVIHQATDALHYAHDLRERGGDTLGIVHRDVTPTNLFLTDTGVVKVLDFGIAKVKDVSSNTQAGTVKGKYAYMSPEQLRGAVVDRRADVFALGVVVYEMLALRRLFQRKTDYLTFRAVLEQPIMDIRRYRPDCPDVLADALMRALDRDPAARFDTARQFGTAVLDAVSSVRRPWTQGEIGDFVRAHFAAEIAQRSAQISAAVRAGADRHVMPLISRPDDDTTEVDGDTEEFGEASSEVSETPVDVRHLVRPSAHRIAVDEPAEPPPNLDALRAVPAPTHAPQPPIVVVARRSVVWPLVAFAMVAVSGGALFLVWRQTQTAGTTVVIDRGPRTQVVQSGSDVIEVGPQVAPPPGGSSAELAVEPPAVHGAPAVEPARAAADRRRPASNPYQDLVKARKPEADRCTAEHGELPRGASLKIVIGPDGHPKSLTLVPAAVDATPLGTCIKNVFRGVTFPRIDHDFNLDVRLRSA
ncbi:MAG TPA: serine/threonine-protein kinase [Kofleriaceae bacterium]|jgi:serine/threonine-protein kinase|nr:serine/threonine-protein kinase [Kofleriaceae bacterium]